MDTKAETIQSEVRETVETGSALMTDSHLSYRGLADEYVHEFVDHTWFRYSELAHFDGLNWPT